MLLTVKQAAEALGVSTGLVYALCAAKKLRHERHGLGRGRIRIPEDALEEYRRRVTVLHRATPAGGDPGPKPAQQPARPKLRHLRLD